MTGVVYVGGPPVAPLSVLPEAPTLTIPVPLRGWLTLTAPRDDLARFSLAKDWVEATVASCRAAGLGRLARPRLVAVARPVSIARRGYPGVRAAEDVRPTLGQVIAGLVVAGVLGNKNDAEGREIRLGVPTGPAGEQGYLQVWLTEAGS